MQVAARARLLSRLQFDAAAGLEGRRYLEDITLRVTRAGQNSVRDPVRREDQRWFARLGASYQLLAWLALGLRYDLVVNRSNASEPTDWNYEKQVMTADARIAW